MLFWIAWRRVSKYPSISLALTRVLNNFPDPKFSELAVQVDVMAVLDCLEGQLQEDQVGQDLQVKVENHSECPVCAVQIC